MALLTYLKRIILKKREPKGKLTYVQEVPYESDAVDTALEAPEVVPINASEIDLTHQRDLEDYAQELTVSEEAIEQWISAGLLMPGELEVAEKIVKIMRKQKKDPSR
jgi:hypothetical protein